MIDNKCGICSDRFHIAIIASVTHMSNAENTVRNSLKDQLIKSIKRSILHTDTFTLFILLKQPGIFGYLCVIVTVNHFTFYFSPYLVLMPFAARSSNRWDKCHPNCQSPPVFIDLAARILNLYMNGKTHSQIVKSRIL